MNKNGKKNRQNLTLILLLCGQFFMPAFANEEKPPLTPNLTSTAKNTAIKTKIVAEQEQQVVAEAQDVIEATQKALVAIEKNEPKNALAILQEASGELDVMLAKHPDLELVSADIDTSVVEFEGDADEAKKAIAAAENFLDDGNIQYARQILDELVSEARITTTSIPLKSYSSAIKQALAYLANGKSGEAAGTLYKALHTLDRTTEIIPLPVLHAELMLTEAAEIEHKQGLSKAQNRTEVLNLVDAAADQLKLAQLLGYGNKNDYKDLYAAIDDFKEAIFSEKSSAMWASVKQHLTALKNRLTFFKK